MKPIIGITSYLEHAAWGPWAKEAALLPAAYVRAVELAGGRPLLVPPSLEGIEETLAVLDGLLLSGGSDIDPSLYGQSPHRETTLIHPVRDNAEVELTRAALSRDLPVLAICRGMELVNVVYGGTLEQHLPDRTTEVTHKLEPGVYTEHDVSIKPDSRLGAIIGSSSLVHSHHHQAPDHLGDGLAEVAWAADGTVEGLEDPSKRFLVGVLWHPEEGDNPALFEAFVRAAVK